MSSGASHPPNAPLAKGMLFTQMKSSKNPNTVRCTLCSRYCVILDGKKGFCQTRINHGGQLYSLVYGQPAAAGIYFSQTKPFFHYRPGTKVLALGTQGCNFRCLNCQNYVLSQSLTDATLSAHAKEFVQSKLPREIVDMAVENKAEGITYTYNEPTLFFEYARDIVRYAKSMDSSRQLFHAFVSNGYFSKETFDIIQKERLFDGIRIDLKFMDSRKYQRICQAKLQPVLDSIERVFLSGIHLEIVNLVIPGENDDPESIEQVCKFVHSLSDEIPLHFYKFIPFYKLDKVPPTSDSTLRECQKIARKIGLKYVYIQNSDIRGVEDTDCPKCAAKLIERNEGRVVQNKLIRQQGKKTPVCPFCGEKIKITL